MKCQSCHGEVNAGASFCQTCGAKLLTSDTGRDTLRVDAADAGLAGKGRDVPEEVLWEGSFSPKAMLGTFIVCGALSVLSVAAAVALGGSFVWLCLGLLGLMWLYALGQLTAARLGVRYKLTNQMFYHQKGVLVRVTDRIELIEIHDVTWEQGLLERLVNVGKVKIASSDRTDPIFLLRGIENVEQVAAAIDKARRAEQVRRGRRIESIGMHHG